MFHRDLQNKITKALNNFRIVLISGPRQSGKTVLAKKIAEQKSMDYITFDDPQILEFAKKDPNAFINHYARNSIVIDEIQLVPELIPILKMTVDESPAKGRFLLTGSADLIKMNLIKESLAGRMVSYHLYPLSNKEINKRKTNLIDYFFAPQFIEFPIEQYQDDLDSILKQLIQGGYPEIKSIDQEFQTQWFDSYLEARLEKDIKDNKIYNLHKLAMLPKILSLLANQTASLLNINQIAKKLQIDHKTTQAYLMILEAMFIIQKISPYHSNKSLSLVKSSKIHFIDTGLLCHLNGLDKENLLLNKDGIYGNIIENFIFSELLKQNTSAINPIKIHHFRDLRKKEVDLILQAKNGDMVAIEVKAKSIITSKDLKGLLELNKNEDKIVNNYIIYSGEEIRPMSLGDKVAYLIPLKLFC